MHSKILLNYLPKVFSRPLTAFKDPFKLPLKGLFNAFQRRLDFLLSCLDKVFSRRLKAFKERSNLPLNGLQGFLTVFRDPFKSS